MCSDTLLLSVFVQMFLFMAQALICRCYTPGVSGFVNSSVRALHVFIMVARRLPSQPPYVGLCPSYSVTIDQILNSKASMSTNALHTSSIPS